MDHTKVNSEPDDDEKSKKAAETSGFSNTVSSYVTILGYSVGMSDFWRFPFLVYRNGGGAFLIPFVLTVLLCGLPLFFLEYTIGNFSGKGPYKVWDICPLFRGVGVAATAAYFIYLVGSTIFRTWLIHFLVNTFKDPLPWTHCENHWNTVTCRSNPLTVQSQLNVESTGYGIMMNNVTSSTLCMDEYNCDTAFKTSNLTLNTSGMTAEEEFWQYEALSLSSGIEDLGSFQWNLVLYMVLYRLVVFLCMIKGIKTIEKISYFTTFFPVVFMVAVFVRSLTLPGATDGLIKFFSCDFNYVSKPTVWIEAFLMAFYTLSFGFGTILTLGSHVQFKDDSVRSCTILPVLDAIWAILSGVVCFSILGNMAHAYGVQVDEVIQAGMSLGVVSYITALSTLPLPQLWTCAFLLSAIVTGIDSQAIPIQMSLQVLGEMFPSLYPKYRIRVLVIVSIVLFLLSLPTCTEAGAYIFLWMDWYTGSWIGPISAFVELIVITWIYGIDRFNADVRLMIGKPIPHFIRLTISFVAPAVVVVIFFTSCVEYVPPTYGEYVYPAWTRILGWLLVTAVMSPLLLYMIKMIGQQNGTCYKRLKLCLESNFDWRPKDKTVQEQFMISKNSFKRRTIRDVFHFAVLGRYKYIEDRNDEEMYSFPEDL